MPDATPPTPAVCPTCFSRRKEFRGLVGPYVRPDVSIAGLCPDSWHDTAADPTPTPMVDEAVSRALLACRFGFTVCSDSGSTHKPPYRCPALKMCGGVAETQASLSALINAQATIDTLTAQVESLEAEREALRAALDSLPLSTQDDVIDALAALDTTDQEEAE